MGKKENGLLGFVMFLTMTGYGVVLPSLPYLAEELHLSSFQMGSLITGWAVAQLLCTPFWGRMADRLGRKPVLLFGLFGFGVAFFALLFAQTYVQLLLARVLGALLSSGAQPAAFAMVADSTERTERSRMMAKMGAMNGLGFLCGPMVGGIFSPFGVEVPFVVAGALAWATLPFVWVYLKETGRKTQASEELPLWHSLAKMFHPDYRTLFGIVLGLSIAASSLLSMLGYFMIERFQATLFQTSIGFSVQSGVSVLIQFFAMGYVYRRWSEESVALIGILANTIGFFLIASSAAVWMVILGCAFVGLGNAMVRPTIIALLSKRGGMGQGITMGLKQSVESLGRIVGPLWSGWLFSFAVTGPFIASALISLFLTFILWHSRRQLPLPESRRHSVHGKQSI